MLEYQQRESKRQIDKYIAMSLKISAKEINYEIVSLQALRDKLRCKEIWVVGADRYRNPDEDLPTDFQERREENYKALKQPLDPKLYRPETGINEAFPNLQPILTRAINWEPIMQQYDQMVKYATALRLGTAETEAILKRFTRNNYANDTTDPF